MDSPMKSLAVRAVWGFAHASSNGTRGTGVGTGSQKNGTAAQNFIQALVFAESKSVRTSTIILASFNALAAFATAVSILYDCHWASKRCNPKFKASKFCISTIHPAETFPLVLAIGIVIQGVAFAAIQSTGLTALTTWDCGLIGQFMLPALFIVPYVQVVFGLECALRSLRKLPFQARGKYDVTKCAGIVVLMLIGTWLPTYINPQPNGCFASLVWFVTRFSVEITALLGAAGGLMILSTMIIFVRLSKANMIDQHQRIAASRMVYYLVLGIVSQAFVIPFFVTVVMSDADLKAGMMATVVLNLSGLMNGLLHLFLRSNTATTSFGPKIGRSWDRQRHEIRIWGPNELAFTNQLADPVSGPRTPDNSSVRSESRTGLVGLEKERPISMDSLRSPEYNRSPTRYNELQGDSVRQMSSMPRMNAPLAELPTASPKRTHARKQSYSLFPNDPTSPVTSPPLISRQEPTSVYDISDLKPPPSIFGGGRRILGHRRDSSVASSATVQIGLRISHALQPSREDLMTLPLPSTTYNAAAKRPVSPLRVNTQVPPATMALSPPPHRPTPLKVIKSPTQSTSTPTRESCANKSLPPTPKAAAFIPKVQRIESTTQLSPAVYSPQTKFPRVIGTPPQSASSPKKNPLESYLAESQQSNSSRQPEIKGKADWI